MSEEKIKATAIMKSERAVALFEEILNQVKQGGIHFEHNGRSMEMITGDAVEMEIEAKHKDGKNKLEFELIWKDDLHLGQMSEEGMSALKVSSRKTQPSDGQKSHERVSEGISRQHVPSEDPEESMAVEASLF